MVKGRRSKRRRCPATSLTDDLTDDLVLEILSRLPARSVRRFKCVSMTWRDLISVHNRKLPQTLAGIFGMHYDIDRKCFGPHFTNVLGRDCPLVSPTFDFLPLPANKIRLLDSCNGLILCGYWPGPTATVCPLFVCNPATKKWVQLPDSKQANKGPHMCLGFNPTVSPHFYVFEFFPEYDDNFSLAGHFFLVGHGAQVYSSETGQWVCMGDKDISYNAHYYPHMFLNNGCLHYLTDEPAIAVVDIQGKARRSIPVPDNRKYGFIQQSQGRLYYANFEADDEDQVVRLVVYVLEDYENQRWTLKHTAEAFDVLGRESSNIARDFMWVAIHPDCNMIFYTVGWDKTLMSYDMDRRQVQVICTLGFQTLERFLPYVPLYSELQSLHI